jgi:transcriptional regulator with PAS, ATPase and Fis domain
VSILILGETGTGKDVLARAIHAHSARAEGPFAVFDSGAVAPNLIESDLFGHEKGAFTGAVASREGVFERGHTGTVFLDEIGELPLELQPRLLRVLEQRRVHRVGSEGDVPADVRVVSATNCDLEVEVEAGRFRQDLFFRLSAAVVQIPPLRDRLEDLPALVSEFLRELDIPLTVSPATLTALRSYDWPGNVRELRNVIESASALAEGRTLEPRHLLFFKHQRRAPTLERLPLAGRTLEALERAAIKQTLVQTDGNKAKAARTLGIASSTLYEKIKKYGI